MTVLAKPHGGAGVGAASEVLVWLTLWFACLPAPEAAPPAAPPAAEAAQTDRYTLGSPVRHGALAVWPVLDTRPSTTGEYLTLADGLAGGRVEVVEKDGGTVPELLVKNTSDLALFLAAGDLVTGGRQDRVIVADHVVPPRSEAAVAVNCVEHGRWSGGAQFAYGGRVEYQLKQAVEIDTEQSKTWAKVAELNARKGETLMAKGVVEDELAPTTGTYRASMDADAVRAEAGPYAAAVRSALTGERVVGLVVAFGGDVVGTELFGSPALLARSRDGIAEGVARDAVSRGSGAAAAPEDATARAFLAEALAAKPAAPVATGGAVRASTENDATVGKELTEADGDLVHRSAYKK